MNVTNFFILLFAYLLGSINSAIIVCYIFRLPSPRSIGSGNPGTTNVLRIGGKIPAAITLIFDILKGLIPVIVAKEITHNDLLIAFVSLYAIIGHIFPIFFDFKGGKGVATLIGALFGFWWVSGLIFIVIWLIIATITRYSSLSAIVATIVASISIFFVDNDFIITIPFLIIAIIILVKHKDNIKRLINKQEDKIGGKKTKGNLD